MKAILLALAIIALGSPVLADPWKDESGKGRWRYGGPPVYDYDYDHGDREYKEEFRVGNCKIERKWEGGEYKEERKCKAWD
jgi:hypothetical protein